jgi:hypothetical protein
MAAPKLVSRFCQTLKEYQGAKNSTYTQQKNSRTKYQRRFTGTDYFIKVFRRQFNHITRRYSANYRRYASYNSGERPEGPHCVETSKLTDVSKIELQVD